MRAAILGAIISLVASGSVTAQDNTGSASSNLRHKTRTELVECFSAVDKCGTRDKWDIADILGKKANEDFLLSAFVSGKDPDQRLGIIYSLYRIDDTKVAAFFKKLVAERFDDGEELYYILNYLAKRCDSQALRALCGHGKGGYAGYPGCLQWSTTVKLFGQCRYRPAIPYLIDSIGAACMNIGIEAVEDLKKMYPGSPDFDNYSIEEIQQYFKRRAASEPHPKK